MKGGGNSLRTVETQMGRRGHTRAPPISVSCGHTEGPAGRRLPAERGRGRGESSGREQSERRRGGGSGAECLMLEARRERVGGVQNPMCSWGRSGAPIQGGGARDLPPGRRQGSSEREAGGRPHKWGPAAPTQNEAGAPTHKGRKGSFTHQVPPSLHLPQL